ncbi:NmrA family protein [Lysinibacillus xylanilyticus]|uniref:NmrA family protein n=1 Tax=Lysinibacillus xylanilyticus TaxID=582475 RepID=A0A0K9FCE2_9BACI|nr:SDR family oxidoreductase [Lysinibacillus xylanilyticus]KMY32249.1 NmrA family protein [Lysinibacillus xylanilyticus]
MKILVTGATGKLGSKVVEALLKTILASDLVVSVQNPEKAEGLRALGVEVRHGNFNQPKTLDSAFSGIDRLLIISTFGDYETIMRQHKNAVAAAERAQVKFIAYTSVTNASESNFFLASSHRAREEAILKTGIPYSFLRNNWYFENEIGSIQGAMVGAPWITSAGKGKVGWVLRQDLAEAAANVLTGKGHENTVYELSGKLMTQEKLVSALVVVLGKEVHVQQVDDATYANIMKGAGVPEAYLPMLVNTQKGIRDGGLEIESNDLEKLLGRPSTPVNEALSQIISQIS